MIIGLDLDNTIVDCNEGFQRQAENLLDCSLAGYSREAIRNMVRQERGDSCWTQIQAEVYGPLYRECRPCLGALEAIAAIAEYDHVSDVVIISHKTQLDSAGKNYKLRDYARAWLEAHAPLARLQVCFAETIDEKRRLIIEKNCAVFLDDLLDIVQSLQNKIPYPVLFNPESSQYPMKDKVQVCDWPSFGAFVRDASRNS